jgi:hypothetical protein
VQQAYDAFSEVESQWRSRVGERRWATFRKVLDELTVDAGPRADGEGTS